MYKFRTCQHVSVVIVRYYDFLLHLVFLDQTWIYHVRKALLTANESLVSVAMRYVSRFSFLLCVELSHGLLHLLVLYQYSMLADTTEIATKPCTFFCCDIQLTVL